MNWTCLQTQSSRTCRPVWVLPLYILMGACVVGISAWAHIVAGFTLPIPWNDEPWLLWKSLAWAREGDLFTPELNPGRLIVNFPIYEILHGLIIRYFGFDLSISRWFVWFCGALAYVAGSSSLFRQRYPLLGLGLFSASYLGSTSVACGNIVRPDTLVVAWSMLGIWFWIRAPNDPWCPLACGLLAMSLHPAGGFVLAPFAIHALVRLIRKPSVPNRSGWVMLSLSLVCFLWIASFSLSTILCG